MFVIAALSLAACSEEIILDIPETTPRIIVNGTISDTLPVNVQVFTSAPYFTEEVPKVSNASIYLFEDGNRVDSLVEIDTIPGYYEGSYLGTIGSKYSIEVVIHNNNPQYEASTWVSDPELLKLCPPIDSFYSEYRQRVPPIQPEGYYVAANFQESPDRGDFYRVQAWRNDTLQNTQFDLTTFSDQFFNGLYLTLTVDGPKPIGTTYKLKVSSITSRHFDYLQLLAQQTAQVGSPFDAPPASVIGNIHRKGDPTDWALGYFNAADLSFAETVIVE